MRATRLRRIDAVPESPDDLVPWREAPAVTGPTHRAEARQVVVLYAQTSL